MRAIFQSAVFAALICALPVVACSPAYAAPSLTGKVSVRTPAPQKAPAIAKVQKLRVQRAAKIRPVAPGSLPLGSLPSATLTPVGIARAASGAAPISLALGHPSGRSPPAA